MKINPTTLYEAVWTSGETVPVEILAQYAKGKFPVLVRVPTHGNPVVLRFTDTGLAEPNYGMSHLQERSPYADWPIDAEVLVCDHPGDGVLKRHFAGVENGKPYAWADGETSWSTDGDKLSWKCMKLREQKDEANKGSGSTG